MPLTKVDAQLVSGAITTDSSGKVGIGVAPAYSLDVLGTINARSAAIATIQLYSTNATDQSNTIGSYANSGAAFSQLNHSASFYTWGTSGTERMRIDSSGNMLLGATSLWAGTGKLTVHKTGAEWARTTNHTNSGTQYFDGFGYNGTIIGAIQGNNTSTSYLTTSDYRLKENIAPMTEALTKVQALRPVTYTWKADGSDGQGFIAHELQAVVPDAVIGEKDALNEDGSIKPQGIDTSFLVATLTAAIQELKAELDATKAEVAALKAKLA